MGRLEKNHGIQPKAKDRKRDGAREEVLGKKAMKAKKNAEPEGKGNGKKGKKEEKPKKPLNRILLILLMLFILVGGGSLAYQFLNSGLISSVVPFVPMNHKFNDGEVTILMVGSDARNLKEPSRSDTILVGRFNFKEGWLRMISIPRDSLVPIPGYADNKINSAYALGGIDLTQKTIEKLYGITIDRSIEINFFTFQSMVDKLGGVEIIWEEEKPLIDSEWGLYIYPGSNILKGEVALNFVRYRHTAIADLGRISRQQLFIKSLAHDIKNKANVFEQADIISGMFSELKTDLSLNELFYMFNAYKNLDDFRITTWMSAGETKTIDGGSYVIPDTNIKKLSQGFLDGSLVVAADDEGGVFPELITLEEKAEIDRKAAEKAAEANTTAAKAAAAAKMVKK